MVKIYAVVLVVAVAALLAWIGAHAYSQSATRDTFDPEQRFGIPGRRVVGGAMAFALAGMSAEFSPRDLSWPVALLLAIVGAAVMAWYVGRPALNVETSETEFSAEDPAD